MQGSIETLDGSDNFYHYKVRPSAEEHNKKLQQRSGEISSSDPLVGFLYDLMMRDHMQPSDMEDLVRNQTKNETKFSNGYLAKYAIDLVERLK